MIRYVKVCRLIQNRRIFQFFQFLTLSLHLFRTTNNKSMCFRYNRFKKQSTDSLIELVVLKRILFESFAHRVEYKYLQNEVDLKAEQKRELYLA